MLPSSGRQGSQIMILKFLNLPLAPRDRAWDASAAEKRVREWSGAQDGPNEKYGRAFLYHDSAEEGGEDGNDKEEFGDYKFPYADVIDGKLTCVPRAIFAAAARLNGSKIPDADKKAMRTHIEKYYAKMRKAFDDDNLKAPWERSAAGAYERRTFILDQVRVEQRDSGDGDGGDSTPIIRGHAAVFNSEAQIWPGMREKVAPGAFSETIKADDIRALFNHNPDIVLGRNKSGTLKLSEDQKGLAIEIDPPDTQAARDLMVSMERGDIDQMSFAFRVETQEWQELDDGTVLRTLKQVRISDVSPVTYPAYDDTDVSVARSELRHFRELREVEHEPEPPEPSEEWRTQNALDALRLEEVS